MMLARRPRVILGLRADCWKSPFSAGLCTVGKEEPTSSAAASKRIDMLMDVQGSRAELQKLEERLTARLRQLKVTITDENAEFVLVLAQLRTDFKQEMDKSRGIFRQQMAEVMSESCCKIHDIDSQLAKEIYKVDKRVSAVLALLKGGAVVVGLAVALALADFGLRPKNQQC